jgi:hypothetical protein
MLVFLAPWILFVVGLGVHVFIDHSPLRHTWPRLVELTLLWLLVFGGTTSMIAALAHLGPWSIDLALAILGVVLLVLYRRGLGKLPRGPPYGVVGAAQGIAFVSRRFWRSCASD